MKREHQLMFIAAALSTSFWMGRLKPTYKVSDEERKKIDAEVERLSASMIGDFYELAERLLMEISS